jgi:hypothetical protein
VGKKALDTEMIAGQFLFFFSDFREKKVFTIRMNSGNLQEVGNNPLESSSKTPGPYWSEQASIGEVQSVQSQRGSASLHALPTVDHAPRQCQRREEHRSGRNKQESLSMPEVRRHGKLQHKKHTRG